MKKPFSGWKEGLPYYGPVLAAGLIMLAALGTSGPVWLGASVFVLLLGVAVLLFFRDFPRVITAAEADVVSPADGTVTVVEDLDETPHYSGPARRVSIFLSVFNVHVNRAPFECTVTDVIYAPGAYHDARSPECSRVNESNAVWLDTPRGPMTVRQISGAVARRIVCPVEEGTVLAKGEKFGMIRFGSRTELFLPPGTEICVKAGDKVNAGLTVLARFEDA